MFRAVNSSRVEHAAGPTVLAALVHITLSSSNQSHELSCSEVRLLNTYEYPCFSFFPNRRAS